MHRRIQDAQIALADIDQLHRQPVFVPHLVGIGLLASEQVVIEKGGDELERHHPHPQVGHYPAGQDRIQPSGKQTQRRGPAHTAALPALRAISSSA